MSGQPRNIKRIQSELEQLFDNLWQVPRFTGNRSAFRPHVDTFRPENGAELTVVVELAGVDSKDVHIQLDGRMLSLWGERRRRLPGRRASYYQLEVEYGPFERHVELPEDVDPEGARARYERGLLTITLPIVARRRSAGRVAIVVRHR
jgi:HSP20 family protein